MADGVRIDTDGVNEFGRGLRTEADSGFADVAGRGVSLHGHGVEFGARMTPSAIVTDAKKRYAEALANTEANLRAHQTAAAVLADAAEEIARMFKTQDMSSEQAMKKVNDLIDEAAAAVNHTIEDALTVRYNYPRMLPDGTVV